MAYNKTVWKDQDVENPRTYTQRQNDDGSVTLLDHFGTITELGTPVNAKNMNKIEQGIANEEKARIDADNALQTAVNDKIAKSSIKQDLSTPSADTVLSTEGAANESSRIVSIINSVQTVLSSSISDETTNRTNADNNLQNQINNKISWWASGNCVRLGSLQICFGNSAVNQTITFQQPFKDAGYKVAFCQTDPSAHTYNNIAAEKKTTSFKFTSGYTGDWIAIGYWY